MTEDADLWQLDNWDVKKGWKGPVPVPRVCSYCGSISFADLKVLTQAGWFIHVAKLYKGFLFPFNPKMNTLALSDRWSPSPVVKFYTHHFTEDQVIYINELITQRRTDDDGTTFGYPNPRAG
jgi:hypothetical protein